MRRKEEQGGGKASRLKVDINGWSAFYESLPKRPWFAHGRHRPSWVDDLGKRANRLVGRIVHNIRQVIIKAKEVL